MKKQYIVALFLLVSLTAFAQKKEKIKGNREVTTVIYEIDPFTSLEVKEGLEIVLLNGETPKVEVITDENLHEVFMIDVEEGTLRIATSKEIRSYKKLEIFVTISKDLERIHAENEAELKSVTTLTIDKAEINALGKAELDLKIMSDSLAINGFGKTKQRYEITTRELIVTGFEDAEINANVTTTKLTTQVEYAEVNLQGKTDVLYAEVKEKGEFTAYDLMAKEIHITTTEQGKAVLNASEKITIDAHDRSEIDLLGNPESIIMYKFEEEAVLRKISEANKGFLKRIF
ncbi:putative autotransporter adhesin-like protein [Kordia periserrulae]|uniref:Putative autotransporter adhesin-like protein n=1 Tax=Kordia periserrulae TaxID=701523 RepID=A0A2T6C040_9FLAO|nr:DUF2807 domain-containing protein [Kordia periserrulae]PTX61685.1 putative autotransporter adhesin-like protein [Kordia periserrulae]